MLAPFKILIVISASLQTPEPIYLKVKPYEPYNLNKIITTQDMYNTNTLIEKIFMQEKR